MIEHAKNGSAEESKQRSGGGFKTLVVDDEPDLADITGQLLAYHGIDVLVVYSAHAALELLESRIDIDAVFSDVMMPRMTGLELAETVAIAYPAIRIVLASGFIAPAYWKQHSRRFSFVEKPYSIDTVIRLLKPEVACQDFPDS